ncbi:hypothetical protein [Pseudomonas corrugata]
MDSSQTRTGSTIRLAVISDAHSYYFYASLLALSQAKINIMALINAPVSVVLADLA